MKHYKVILFMLAPMALAFIICPQQFSGSGEVAGQRRGTRKVAAPQAARKAPIDYSKFSHATKQHQEACKSCHKTPTANWDKVREFPDVADYPDHDACVRCHRQQFFKGVQPVICTVCHVKTSPRDDARLAFRNPAAPQQFTIEFPHDKHQDVIASLRWRPKSDRAVNTFFVKSAHVLDDKKQNYYNCEICHVANTKALAAPATGWLDGYAPAIDTFKAAPDGHASCFNCHWKSQEPIRNNCGGCHKLANAPFVLPASHERKSIKFRHEGGGEKRTHAVPPTECTSCHINITKSATLRGLKPDVPITGCTECHNKSGIRQDLNKELASLDQDKKFVCSYCHTSNVGKLDPPASHYVVAERRALKRKDLK
jgi:hypothetical protein